MGNEFHPAKLLECFCGFEEVDKSYVSHRRQTKNQIQKLLRIIGGKKSPNAFENDYIVRFIHERLGRVQLALRCLVCGEPSQLDVLKYREGGREFVFVHKEESPRVNYHGQSNVFPKNMKVIDPLRKQVKKVGL